MAANQRAHPKGWTDDGYVYTPYITRNGKRIYRKDGGMFRFKDRRHKH